MQSPVTKKVICYGHNVRLMLLYYGNLPVRYGEGVSHKCSWQRISWCDEQSGQWTFMHEVDQREELYDTGIADRQRHQTSRELLQTCPVHWVEWTFVRHCRRTRNGASGTMQSWLLRYYFLRLFLSHCVIHSMSLKIVSTLMICILKRRGWNLFKSAAKH